MRPAPPGSQSWTIPGFLVYGSREWVHDYSIRPSVFGRSEIDEVCPSGGEMAEQLLDVETDTAMARRKMMTSSNRAVGSGPRDTSGCGVASCRFPAVDEAFPERRYQLVELGGFDEEGVVAVGRGEAGVLGVG